MVLALAQPQVHKLFPDLFAARDLEEIRLRPLSPRAVYRYLKHCEPVEVEVRRLDRVVDETLGGLDGRRPFLKLDTQGYDLDVFAGAGHAIDRFVGLQSELSLMEIYKGMPRMREALAAYEGRPVVVGIRPEDMEDASLVSDAPPERRIRSTVELSEALGSDVLVHFSLDAPPAVSEDIVELAADVAHDPDEAARHTAGASSSNIIARLNPRTRARNGEAIELEVDTTRLHFFDPATGAATSRKAEHSARPCSFQVGRWRSVSASTMRAFATPASRASGREPRTILDFDAKGAFEELGLSGALSSQRSNGLASMVARMSAVGSASVSLSGQRGGRSTPFRQ